MNLIKLAGDKLVPVIDTAGMKKKDITALKKEGYKEFFFSDKPEPVEGEKIVLSFEEINNKIYQRWILELDPDYYQKLIDEKKSVLAASDYKIIKCQEAQLAGKRLPYDITELNSERQAIRDEINLLEKYLKH